MSARHIVVVRAAYPADGERAVVTLLPLTTTRDPYAADFADYPGPLVKGNEYYFLDNYNRIGTICKNPIISERQRLCYELWQSIDEWVSDYCDRIRTASYR